MAAKKPAAKATPKPQAKTFAVGDKVHVGVSPKVWTITRVNDFAIENPTENAVRLESRGFVRAAAYADLRSAT